jgi:uncharacterized protein (TIGR03435 family)
VDCDALEAEVRSFDSWPALLAAIEAQLGLRLASEQARVPTLVVEHVEPPTPN